MKENFAYLKDVLGLKYVSKDRRQRRRAEFKATVTRSKYSKVRILFLNHGPGQTLDNREIPYRGAEGELLRKMIQAMHLKQGDFFIVGRNETLPPEVMDDLDPEVIVAFGSESLGAWPELREFESRGRGKSIELGGRKLVITLSPAHLLKTPSSKKQVWDDLKLALQILSEKS